MASTNEYQLNYLVLHYPIPYYDKENKHE